ncbi:hypothetical protein SLE2022_358680 [Rubroshorea leprosula]
MQCGERKVRRHLPIALGKEIWRSELKSGGKRSGGDVRVGGGSNGGRKMEWEAERGKSHESVINEHTMTMVLSLTSSVGGA